MEYKKEKTRYLPQAMEGIREESLLVLTVGGSKMWNIKKEDSLEKWESDICNLRVIYDGEKCNIYVDYKGYNVIIPIGILGFEDEIQKRRIDYDINGETGNFKSLSYVISKNDLRLFCDMIYFFLSENSLDEALNPAFKY